MRGWEGWEEWGRGGVDEWGAAGGGWGCGGGEEGGEEKGRRVVSAGEWGQEVFAGAGEGMNMCVGGGCLQGGVLVVVVGGA